MAASILPDISEFWDTVLGCPGKPVLTRSLLVEDGYRYWVLVTYSGGFARMEDRAASRYYQNTISRLGRPNVLSQK